jgi:hypothetical protein
MRGRSRATSSGATGSSSAASAPGSWSACAAKAASRPSSASTLRSRSTTGSSRPARHDRRSATRDAWRGRQLDGNSRTAPRPLGPDERSSGPAPARRSLRTSGRSATSAGACACLLSGAVVRVGEGSAVVARPERGSGRRERRQLLSHHNSSTGEGFGSRGGARSLLVSVKEAVSLDLAQRPSGRAVLRRSLRRFLPPRRPQRA